MLLLHWVCVSDQSVHIRQLLGHYTNHLLPLVYFSILHSKERAGNYASRINMQRSDYSFFFKLTFSSMGYGFQKIGSSGPILKRKIYWLIIIHQGIRAGEGVMHIFHFLSCHYVWSVDGGGQKCTRLLITIFLDWNSWTMATRPTFTIPDKTRQLFFISSSYASTDSILKSLGRLFIFSTHILKSIPRCSQLHLWSVQNEACLLEIKKKYI